MAPVLLDERQRGRRSKSQRWRGCCSRKDPTRGLPAVEEGREPSPRVGVRDLGPFMLVIRTVDGSLSQPFEHPSCIESSFLPTSGLHTPSIRRASRPHPPPVHSRGETTLSYSRSEEP